LSTNSVHVGGPYFEDLERGELVEAAPAVTLSDAHAALHQAILGDRLRLPLDATLSRDVVGGDRPLAHPALVCDIAIGQSTLVTRRVVANLFYRGLALRRSPLIGDTLHTTTEVVGLRENRRREGRSPTGLAALRIRTVDQNGERVLDFWRCAMLPLRPNAPPTGHADDLDAVGAAVDPATLAEAMAGWDLGTFRERVPGQHSADLTPGTTWIVDGGDVVSSAPELARLTLNVASAHHDDRATDGADRLVYGGHTIGIAAAQATRALPNLVTILAWHSCDHVGPVREGDTLRSSVELEQLDPLASGALVHLRSRVQSDAGGDVLDWRFVGLVA
jgi:acyl dehydratase